MSTSKKKAPVFDPGLCRCCGAKAKCRVLNEKYEDMIQNEVYSVMIMNCFGVELSHLDAKPSERLICIQCVNKLQQALSFKIQVLLSEQLFLQNRMRNTHSGPQIHFKLRELQSLVFKTEMNSQHDCDEDVDNVMSDGLDDEIDGELLQEYYSLESQNYNMIDESTSLNNLFLQETKEGQYSEPRVLSLSENRDHRMEPNDMDRYSSAEDDLPLKRMMDTRKLKSGSKSQTSNLPSEGKQDPGSDIEQNQPFMQASNVACIVKYSYACPFKNRFNHILCYYCDQYFLDPVLLREHTLTHNPKKEFKATRNRYTKLDLTRIDCRLCTEKIDDLEDFKRHLVTEHEKQYFLESKDSVLPFKLVENVNSCTLCGEEFSYFYGLHKHMNQHFSNYMCETCGMGFMDEISLQKHAPAHDGKRYPCKSCGNTFKSEYTRLCHIRRIHRKDEAGSFCTKCDAYLLLHERTKHMVEVHGESPTVPCLGCDQVFNSRRLLTIHVRRAHMNDYRYQCHVCHKKFFRRSSLTFHMPTHTGERNFKCKVCEKSYPRLKTLKEHMRIHTNDRRYRCHICGQAFVQNCSLKGHMRSKHPEYG